MCLQTAAAGDDQLAVCTCQVTYVKGWGKFKSATEVEVDLLEGGTSVIPATNIIIATGSEVTPLPGVPIDEDK